MQNFMMMLLICSLTMSVLALLYMAVMPFLSNHYSERGRYYTWLLIVIALIIPFRPQWNNPLVSVETPQQASSILAQITAGTQAPIAIQSAALPFDNMLTSTTASGISGWQVLAGIWILGAVLFLAYHLIKHHRLAKMLQRWSEPMTAEKEVFFQKVKSEMNVSAQIPIYLCPCVSGPMLLGLFEPRIYLPSIDVSEEELRFILKHELVHYKRKDILYKHLVLIATALHWFNPIVYLMGTVIAALCEKSCDNEVIQHESEDVRLSYGETIIRVAKHQSKLKTVLSTSFYGSKKGMKSRIATVMDVRKKKIGILLGCAVLTLTMSGGYFFAVVPLAGATEAIEQRDELGTILTSFATENGMDSVVVPTDLPEDFVIEDVWMYISANSSGSALYIRFGNGAQSFDMEVKPLMAGGDVFDDWMQHSPESIIDGRRVRSDDGWLSVQADSSVRYTFMWGAFDPALLDPLGDDIFVRIATSLQ